MRGTLWGARVVYSTDFLFITTHSLFSAQHNQFYRNITEQKGKKKILMHNEEKCEEKNKRKKIL